jgi:NAD(P)-dependent dehydrogenase (short-subunit alcohol dehydrogenase family)
MPDQSPKIAVITGGSRGLGRNTAIHLARSGVDVLLTYNSNKAEADAAVAEIAALGRKAAALQLDTGDVASFGAFAVSLRDTLKANWNRETIDYLVNNAGIGLHVPFAEATEADFDRLTNIHFKGVFFLTQKLLPMIVDGGKIVNLSSGLARFAYPGASIYGSLKGAVEVLTRYLAKELGHRRIAVNAIAPGAIETDFGGGRVRDNPDLNRQIAANTAMGRVGLPDDVGGAITALLVGETGWITGQRIEVSGGQGI